MERERLENGDPSKKSISELLDLYFKKDGKCGRYVYDDSLLVFPVSSQYDEAGAFSLKSVI